MRLPLAELPDEPYMAIFVRQGRWLSSSIGEKILVRRHAAKRDLAADFLDGTEAAARMGEEELMALIRG
jgi:hypothetical protein